MWPRRAASCSTTSQTAGWQDSQAIEPSQRHWRLAIGADEAAGGVRSVRERVPVISRPGDVERRRALPRAVASISPLAGAWASARRRESARAGAVRGSAETSAKAPLHPRRVVSACFTCSRNGARRFEVRSRRDTAVRGRCIYFPDLLLHAACRPLHAFSSRHAANMCSYTWPYSLPSSAPGDRTPCRNFITL